MPSGTASVSKKSVSSSKTSKKDASQTETVAEAAPTPAPAPVETPSPVEAPAETATDASEVSPLQAETLALLEMAHSCQNTLQALIKKARSTLSNIKKLERDVKRLEKKGKRGSTRASNGNKGLQQLKPVYTAEMKSFFETHKDLTDNDNAPIVENLTYDSDHLLVSRKQALKLVTSYIRSHKLQDATNKRKINMDATLQSLFPELCSVKDKKGKVVQEENCFYNTLMKALSRHFTAPA
jgi:flagellar motility protein MotE (MotC chaperone)